MNTRVLADLSFYDGIPVFDLGGTSIAILGHYESKTAFAALDRHAREFRGWRDLYDGEAPDHSPEHDLSKQWAVALTACAQHGSEPDRACLMCDFVDGDDLRLLLVDAFTDGAFPVMLWAP